jgi:hypothetical protein
MVIIITIIVVASKFSYIKCVFNHVVNCQCYIASVLDDNVGGTTLARNSHVIREKLLPPPLGLVSNLELPSKRPAIDRLSHDMGLSVLDARAIYSRFKPHKVFIVESDEGVGNEWRITKDSEEDSCGIFQYSSAQTGNHTRSCQTIRLSEFLARTMNSCSTWSTFP